MGSFFDNILDRTATPTLSRTLRFATLRHSLLTENVANATTPGYQQKDLDEASFQRALQQSLEERDRTGRTIDLSNVEAELTEKAGGITYHDGNNRSMEQLMAESAKNALRHNALAELLRKQYAQLNRAVRESPQ